MHVFRIYSSLILHPCLMMDTTAPKPQNFLSVALQLLSYYSLESEHYPQPWTKGKVLRRWLQNYSEQWVRWALIESLYQGRYKAYSVEQILALWSRRGQPVYHFNPEFETMICTDIPQRLEKAVWTDQTIEETTQVDQGRILESEPLDPASVPFLEGHIEDSGLSDPLDAGKTLDSERVDPEIERDYWANVFEQPSMDTRESILTSVLNNDRLLPLTFDRTGLEPIHRFMPEAEPIEFCEKLAAIARFKA